MAIMTHKPTRVDDAVKTLTPLVAKIARKFARNHIQDIEDLMQHGFLGVAEAYDRYDPNKGSAFSSYAYQYIWVHIKEATVKNWKTYNNTASKPVDDYAHIEAATNDNDAVIDFKIKLDRMNNLERSIVKARAEGYTFNDIANALGSLGTDMTLHQVRNTYMAAIAE